jgi:hypothetical protein
MNDDAGQIVGRERREREAKGKRQNVKGKRIRAPASTPPVGPLYSNNHVAVFKSKPCFEYLGDA